MATTLRVLLIDDNPGDARLTMRQLRRLEAPPTAVTHVDCLAEALAALARERFDIVFTDLHLPDGEGVELCRRVTAAAGVTPVFVLSGSLADEELPPCGVRQVLVKGQVQTEALRRILESLVEPPPADGGS